ncbi:hypothetical protein SGCOL_004019 [Colletotrichum sp. CLE4]
MPVRQKSWGLPARLLGQSETMEANEPDPENQSTDAAIKYWLSEAAKLEPKQRILFLQGAEADSYEDYVSGLARAVQNTANSSKVSRLSKKMKPVYMLVKSIAPLIASTDQVSPFPTSLVLGGITCVLSASSRVDDYQSKLFETMELMVDEIDLINRYREEGLFGDDPRIKACEIRLATGKHGSGKSHLASRVIQDLISETKGTPLHAVAYIYCTTTQLKTEMTLTNLLGSLLGQLCRQLPLGKGVKDIMFNNDCSSREPPRRNDLKGGIFKVISMYHSCSIIIDGLDECSRLEDNHFEDLCDFILSLAKNTNAAAKVIVFSRPSYSEIERIMRKVPKVQVDDGANKDDDEKFVSQTIYKLKSDPSPDDIADFEEIKSRLVNNASGMFLGSNEPR